MKRTFLVSCVTFLALAAIGLASSADPVVAQQAAEEIEEIVVIEAPIVVRREKVGRTSTGATVELVELTRRVSYADLDLTKHADVTELDTRIDDAAEEACQQLADIFPLSDLGGAEIGRCTKRGVDGTKEQVQAAIAAASE